jgi:hypothetical protein
LHTGGIVGGVILWKDEIVEEVRHYRDVYVAQFNYDLDAIYRDLKAKESKSKHKLVSFSPKHPLKPATPKVDRTLDV